MRRGLRGGVRLACRSPAARAGSRGARAYQRDDPDRRSGRLDCRGDRDHRRAHRRGGDQRRDQSADRCQHSRRRSSRSDGNAWSHRHSRAFFGSGRNVHGRFERSRGQADRRCPHAREGAGREAQARRVGARPRLGRSTTRGTPLHHRCRSRQRCARQSRLADADDRTLRRRQQLCAQAWRCGTTNGRSARGHDRPRRERQPDRRAERIGGRARDEACSSSLARADEAGDSQDHPRLQR